MHNRSPRYAPPVLRPLAQLLPLLLLIAAPAHAEPLDLRDAVSKALDGNLSLLRARYDVLLARDREVRALGAFEPSLTAGVSRSSDLQNYVNPEEPLSAVTARIGVSQAIPGGGTVGLDYTSTEYSEAAEALGFESFPDLSLRISQPLLSGAILGGRERGVADARFGAQNAELDLFTILSDLVLEVENRYWDLVQAEQTVTGAELALAGAQKQEAWVDERIQLGFDSPSERLATQERVASAQSAMASAAAERANAEAALLFLLGEDLAAADRRVLEASTDPSAFEVLGPEAAHDHAREANLGIRLTRRAVVAARRDLRFTVVEQLPSLDGSFTLRRDFGRPDQLPWTIGVSLTMPLPGRARVHGILSAQARVRQAELALREVEQRLRLSVETALRAVDTARARLALAETGLDVAQRKYDAELEKFSRGRSTNKGVLDYLEDRDTAVRARDEARIQLARTAGTLRRLTGGNLAFWNVDPEALLARTKELR